MNVPANLSASALRKEFKREYRTWKCMKARCYTASSSHFDRYGGRGITVCDRWRDSFENFLTDMGPRPAGMTLGRKDNEQGYAPDNCQWETKQEQNSNTSQNRLVTIAGETLTMTQWARKSGLRVNLLQYRLDHDWPTDRLLTAPSPARLRQYAS